MIYSLTKSVAQDLRCPDKIHSPQLLKIFLDSKDTHIIRYEIREFENKQIKSSLDRLGFVILQADTMSEIETIISKIK